MTALVGELSEVVGVTRACTALDVSRPSYYRRRRPAPRRTPKPRPSPLRALRPSERQEVIEVLHSERFVDQAPAQVVAALLQEGIYHCSARTMYRLLSTRGEVRERRNQLRHPRYRRPELLATGPNCSSLNRLFLMLSPDGPEEAVCHTLIGPKFRGQVTS